MKRGLFAIASIVLILSLVLSFGVIGCSKAEPSTTAAVTPPPPPAPTTPATTTATTPKPIATLSSIVVAPASPAELTVGSTQKFSATGTYSDGSTRDLYGVDWSSDNPAVVTIDRNGLAKARAAGIANITASQAGVTSTPVSLTVVAPPPPPETTPPPGEETTTPAVTTPPFEGPAVYVSVSVDNELLVAAQPVAFTEGMTLEDVIKAAHEAYYPGGASGYDIGTNNSYSMYLVNKCWGVAQIPFIVINGAPLGAVAGSPNTVNLATVAENDNIIICTSNTQGAATPISITATRSGDSITLTVKTWTLNMSTFAYSSVFRVDAEVIDPITGAYLGMTDAQGQITVTIPASGILAIPGLGAISVNSATSE